MLLVHRAKLRFHRLGHLVGRHHQRGRERVTGPERPGHQADRIGKGFFEGGETSACGAADVEVRCEWRQEAGRQRDQRPGVRDLQGNHHERQRDRRARDQAPRVGAHARALDEPRRRCHGVLVVPFDERAHQAGRQVAPRRAFDDRRRAHRAAGLHAQPLEKLARELRFRTNDHRPVAADDYCQREDECQQRERHSTASR